jgi:protein-S-isoprenylcysteine O-methyltransferase Ste14
MLKFIFILAYLGMVAGLLGLLYTRSLPSLSPFVIAPQAAAVALVIWARITFGRRSFHVAANPTPGGLVTTGSYRFIRHPIYTAVCLFTITGVLTHWSWAAAWAAMNIRRWLVIQSKMKPIFRGLVLLPVGWACTRTTGRLRARGRAALEVLANHEFLSVRLGSDVKMRFRA